MLERTLVLVKPDGVQRGLTGEIIQKFERVGLKIIGMKMVWIDEEFAKKHYIGVEERKGAKVFSMLMDLITMGPVVAMVLEGVDAVEVVRKICGPTEPKAAMPGTIRGDYSHVSYSYSDKVSEAVRNVVHASGEPEEAAHEVALWFSPEEIHDYPSVHEVHTLQYKAADIKSMRNTMRENSQNTGQAPKAELPAKPPLETKDAQRISNEPVVSAKDTQNEKEALGSSEGESN